MSKLDPELFQQIRSLCEHAGSLVRMGEDEFAISKYYEALILVPDPKSDHSISTFIYTALGQQYFSMMDYAEAGKCFMKAYMCPGGEAIGQISFRIGQCLEECGERKKAQDYLCQAYLLGCEELFAKSNPKYYKIIRAEVEGTRPEDDELELLREEDEYDIIDTILQSGGGRGSRENYTGYDGGSSDRDSDLYNRTESGSSRTVDEYDDDYDEDDYDNDFDDDDDDGEDEYDAPARERSFGFARRRAEDDEDDEDEDDDSDDGEYDDDDDGESFWAKLTAGLKKITDLFK